MPSHTPSERSKKKLSGNTHVPENVQLPGQDRGVARSITDTVEQFSIGSQRVSDSAEDEERQTGRRFNRGRAAGSRDGRFRQRGMSSLISGLFSR